MLQGEWAPREVPLAQLVSAVAEAYALTEAQAEAEIRRQQREANEPLSTMDAVERRYWDDGDRAWDAWREEGL